jgi:multisubunit Na+/H+ antiporter MnhF subunit
VNAWLIAATVLCAALLLVVIVPLRTASPFDAVVGIELATVVVALAMVLLTEGLGDPTFADLGLLAAVLGLPSALVYVHFFSRWT